MPNILDMLKKVGEVKADADVTMTEFDPRWLVGAIGSQLKKAALNALSANPQIEKLAARLQTDPENARILWNAFLSHLKEDF